jgi:UPF0288 family protein (methanogenesis marker protein 3)
MVGVRFEDNEEFGPTGEPFQGTNIIGRVVKGMEHLEKYKEGDTVYVTRKYQESSEDDKVTRMIVLGPKAQLS